MVGVPVMVPVAELTDRPAGRPLADQVKLAPAWVSVALLARAVMAVPETLARVPGLATDTGPVTVQVNTAAPMAPALSVAVRVTE